MMGRAFGTSCLLRQPRHFSLLSFILCPSISSPLLRYPSAFLFSLGPLRPTSILPILQYTSGLFSLFKTSLLFSRHILFVKHALLICFRPTHDTILIDSPLFFQVICFLSRGLFLETLCCFHLPSMHRADCQKLVNSRYGLCF